VTGVVLSGRKACFAAGATRKYREKRRALLASEPAVYGERRVLFISGNDSAANAQVAVLVDQHGFAVIELGKLSEGGRLQEFGGVLAKSRSRTPDEPARWSTGPGHPAHIFPAQTSANSVSSSSA
jgi:hypothetical protein